MGSLKEKAKALLQQCEVVTLTSINKEGYPRPVPLSKIKTEGLTTIWFATGNSSAKTKDFRSNPKSRHMFLQRGKQRGHDRRSGSCIRHWHQERVMARLVYPSFS